ncbi:hypothetical protein F5Y10DRAFT_256717 [Nemania abortiva]|nr:hypothetical protein F5Y10DRAFT_256717 [Nemania abortiva]
MDPLSVAASVVGLLAAGSKVTSLLFTVITRCKASSALARSILFEVADISAALGHLQDFISNRRKAAAERGNLILLDQLLTTLTGCVTTYSDLQFTLDGLNINADMGTFDRIKWMRQEGSLNTLVQRLQSHKSSLTLMLTIIQCESMEEAKSSTQKLHDLVEQMLESNRDLSERIRGLEREGSIISKARSDVIPAENSSTIHRLSAVRESVLEFGNAVVKRFAFEGDLESSRAYKKAIYRYSQLSLTSTALHTTALSVFSKLSLSQVSSVSFYALPVCAVDLHNSELYIFGEEGAALPNTPAISSSPRPPSLYRRQEDRLSLNEGPIIKATSTPSLPRQSRLLGRFAILQRRPAISPPENPVHLTHVGYDSSAGQFTGLPREWQRLINASLEENR